MRLANARLGDSLADVTIQDGLIASVAAAAGQGGELDLDGRWLYPGLWDNHVHFSQWAARSRRLDVSVASSAAETATVIRGAIDALEAAGDMIPTPFIAVGFRDGLWTDQPTREILDEASEHPIVVVSGDLHAVWLNSSALRLHEQSAQATGVFREDAAFRITAAIDTFPDAVLDSWAAAAAREAAARGVVGIVDYEMAWNLDAWQRRQAAGLDSLRVEFGIYTEHLHAAIERGLRTGDQIDELLTVGGFKILIDGSLNTRTAYCYDPFDGASDEFGMLTVEPTRLVELMTLASAAGIHPAVHAIGDRAVTIALDAFETVGVGGRIEHAQFVADADLPRFAQLGVVASVQPDHAMDDRDVADRYWAGRTRRAFPLRALSDHGATLLFGSDAPVSPLDPWVTISAAVTRTRGDREPWHPEQAVSMAEAIAASTRSTVAAGQPADLVIVENDPFDGASDDITHTSVWATMLAGRFTHGPH